MATQKEEKMVTIKDFIAQWPNHRGSWFPDNLNNTTDLYDILETETGPNGRGRASLVKYVHQRYSRLVTNEERNDYLEKCEAIQKVRAEERKKAKEEATNGATRKATHTSR